MIIDKSRGFTNNLPVFFCQPKLLCYLLIYYNLFIMINQQLAF